MDTFEDVAWCYDWFPVPTHARALRRALDTHRSHPGARLQIVDLGGGTGKYTARIVDPEDAVLVVDATRKMLERARRKRGLKAVEAIAEAIPLADTSTDVVICTEAFHHFGTEQEKAIAEVARILRPDGVFLLEEIDPTRPFGALLARIEHWQGLSSVFHPPAVLQSMLGSRFERVTETRTGRSTKLYRAEGPRDPKAGE